MKKLFLIILSIVLLLSCKDEPINPTVPLQDEKYNWETWCVSENLGVDSTSVNFYDTSYFRTYYNLTHLQIDSAKHYWDIIWNSPPGNPDCLLIYKMFEPEQQCGYFSFFKEGAFWTYDTYGSDGSTHFVQTFTITSIDGDILNHPFPHYANVEWNLNGNIKFINWFASDFNFSTMCSDSSILILCDNSPVISEEHTLFQLDTLWSSRIVSINENIVVPAGSFTKCIKIIQTNDKDNLYYKYIWLTLKDGIIKTESTNMNIYPTIIYEDLTN